MSWTINLNGHLNADGTEAGAVKELVKKITAMAKDAPVGLTYVSANVPNEGRSTFYSPDSGIIEIQVDVDDVKEETALEEDGEEEDD